LFASAAGTVSEPSSSSGSAAAPTALRAAAVSGGGAVTFEAGGTGLALLIFDECVKVVKDGVVFERVLECVDGEVCVVVRWFVSVFCVCVGFGLCWFVLLGADLCVLVFISFCIVFLNKIKKRKKRKE
jgi:hypothetical protein